MTSLANRQRPLSGNKLSLIEQSALMALFLSLNLVIALPMSVPLTLNLAVISVLNFQKLLYDDVLAGEP